MNQEQVSIPSSVSPQINKFLKIDLTNFPKYDTIVVDIKLFICLHSHFLGNIMATKNLIANGLWIIRITKIILTKLSKRNCLGHVKLCEELDKQGKLPAVYMIVPPASWNTLEVWDDINRMRTLNGEQKRRNLQMHVCPLQIDIVERIITRYSNEGELVLDPFGGLMTVPMTAVKMKRRGYGIELNPDYFRDGCGYLEAAEREVDSPTLFDFIGETEENVG